MSVGSFRILQAFALERHERDKEEMRIKEERDKRRRAERAEEALRRSTCDNGSSLLAKCIVWINIV